MRKIVIGDIHGGLRALKQLLDRVDPSGGDQLIFLGDYVDGWSHAAETVNYLIKLRDTHDCVFIRGNHDELCREWLETGKDNPLWQQHGGDATAASYDTMDSTEKQLHIQFYRDLEDYYLDGDHRLFLHAGFTHLRGVENEYFSTMFYWDRTLWEMALSLDPDLPKDDSKYPARLKQYHEVFIGHTPVTRIGKTTPQQAANVWNIDTGAAFKGPISAMEVSSKQIWQSDPVYQLYPGESGRN